MRTCVGGFTCPGSNFDAEDCNTQSCKRECHSEYTDVTRESVNFHSKKY